MVHSMSEGQRSLKLSAVRLRDYQGLCIPVSHCCWGIRVRIGSWEAIEILVVCRKLTSRLHGLDHAVNVRSKPTAGWGSGNSFQMLLPGRASLSARCQPTSGKKPVISVGSAGPSPLWPINPESPARRLGCLLQDHLAKLRDQTWRR